MKNKLIAIDPLALKFLIGTPVYLLGTGIVVDCAGFLHMHTFLDMSAYAIIITILGYTAGSTVYNTFNIIAKMIHKIPTSK